MYIRYSVYSPSVWGFPDTDICYFWRLLRLSAPAYRPTDHVTQTRTDIGFHATWLTCMSSEVQTNDVCQTAPTDNTVMHQLQSHIGYYYSSRSARKSEIHWTAVQWRLSCGGPGVLTPDHHFLAVSGPNVHGPPTLMFSVLKKSACMHSSATVGRTDSLIPWITEHSSMALKSGSPCTFGSHTATVLGLQWDLTAIYRDLVKKLVAVQSQYGRSLGVTGVLVFG